MGEIKKALTEGGAILTAIGGTAESIKNNVKSGESISPRQLMNRAVGAMAGASVPKHKVDASLTYQNSKRREYALTFNLAITPGNPDPEKSVFTPIRKLEELSCAVVENNLIGLQFPAIFRITTTPGSIIKINHAAMTAVQPT